MNACKSCGKDNDPGAQFCTQCGAEIVTPVPAGGVSSAESERSSQPSLADLLLDPLRQATLGDYEILGEIGRGGMAVVYLAHDLSLDRKVAIKVISPSLLMMGTGVRERFKREARTVASLSHPHIIPIYAVKETDDLLYFVMKYVKGRTLESIIDEVGPLPLGMVDTILRQVGGALGYAHRNGVVHRDIKPANIMLDEEGWAEITDFGIAKVTEAEGLTQTGGTVGTPAYMSPEQCLGLPVTGASDQYSLGVVVYEMLAARIPFESESPMTMMYKHCHEPPEPIRTTMPDCPPRHAAAVMRMLEKEPEKRWPTLEAMIDALGVVPQTETDNARTQMTTLVKRASAARIVEKFNTPQSPVPRGRRRRPQPKSAGTGAATQPDESEDAEPPRRRGALWASLAVAAVAVFAVLFASPWSPFRTPAEPESAGSGSPLALAPVAAVRITTGPIALEIGQTATLAASVRDSAGGPLPDEDVTWSSSDPSVASVSTDGRVEALAAGFADITASRAGRSNTVRVTVNAPARGRPNPAPRPPPPAPVPPAAPVVASIALSPPVATLEHGDTIRLRASPRDGSGNELTGQSVTWASSNPQVATVSPQGLVSGIGVGTTQIIASGAGRSSSISVTVIEPTVAALRISPTEGALTVGQTVRLRGTAVDARGNPLAVTVRWTSSDTSVAAVAPSGEVTGRGEGTATITGTGGSQSASATVTVAAVTTPAPANPRPEIEAVIGSLRQAFQARDMDALRRVYPGLTSRQENGYRALFEAADDLRVSMTVTDVRVQGDTARVDVDAVFQSRTIQQQAQTPTLRATLVRTTQGWRLIEVQ